MNDYDTVFIIYSFIIALVIVFDIFIFEKFTMILKILKEINDVFKKQTEINHVFDDRIKYLEERR